MGRELRSILLEGAEVGRDRHLGSSPESARPVPRYSIREDHERLCRELRGTSKRSWPTRGDNWRSMPTALRPDRDATAPRQQAPQVGAHHRHWHQQQDRAGATDLAAQVRAGSCRVCEWMLNVAGIWLGPPVNSSLVGSATYSESGLAEISWLA